MLVQNSAVHAQVWSVNLEFLVLGVEDTSCFQQQHLEKRFAIYLALCGGFYCPDLFLETVWYVYLNTRMKINVKIEMNEVVLVKKSVKREVKSSPSSKKCTSPTFTQEENLLSLWLWFKTGVRGLRHKVNLIYSAMLIKWKLNMLLKKDEYQPHIRYNSGLRPRPLRTTTLSDTWEASWRWGITGGWVGGRLPSVWDWTTASRHSGTKPVSAVIL